MRKMPCNSNPNDKIQTVRNPKQIRMFEILNSEYWRFGILDGLRHMIEDFACLWISGGFRASKLVAVARPR